MDGSAALTLYRQEKERALQERRISHAQLMAEAKEAFAKMLADASVGSQRRASQEQSWRAVRSAGGGSSGKAGKS